MDNEAIKLKIGTALSVVAAVLTFACTAAERVELFDIHQEEANPYILSYSYQTMELCPAITYRLVTTVRATSGLPGAYKWQIRAYTNDVTEANAIVTTSINLQDAFGEDINPGGRIDLSLIGTDATPVGTIYEFAGNVVPNGYLRCDGSEVSRTTYKRLFDVIGTTYGSGNGSTTFTLPNFNGRVAQGANNTYLPGNILNAGMPNIHGKFNKSSGNGGIIHVTTDGITREGALSVGNTASTYYFDDKSSHTAVRGWKFNARDSNSIYGKSDTVQPPAVVVNWIIKY